MALEYRIVAVEEVLDDCWFTFTFHVGELIDICTLLRNPLTLYLHKIFLNCISANYLQKSR